MRSYRSLLQTLNKEAKLQDKLLAILVEERTKIVHLQREELEKLSEKKETLLFELSDLKLERNNLFQSIVSGLDLEIKSPKLPDILKYCEDAGLRADLGKRGESLKELAIKVSELNKENGVLLKQSLGLISSTISLITAKPVTHNPSYGRNAKIASEDESEMTVTSSFNRAV